MTELNDELLSALLDGQLDEPMRGAVEEALAADPGARVRLERMRQMDTLLRAAIPQPSARVDDPLAARIAGESIEAQAPRPRAFHFRAAAAVIAAAALGLLIGRSTPRGAEPFVDASGTVHGALARTLESQASGTQQMSARVIVSVQVRDGRYCRQFALSDAALSGEGVACRGSSDPTWQLIAWQGSATSSNDGFKPASGGALLDSVLDGLGAGEALDVQAERALLQRGWRNAQ